MRWKHETETTIINGDRISCGMSFKSEDVDPKTLEYFVEMGYVESDEPVQEPKKRSEKAKAEKITEDPLDPAGN